MRRTHYCPLRSNTVVHTSQIKVTLKVTRHALSLQDCLLQNCSLKLTTDTGVDDCLVHSRYKIFCSCLLMTFVRTALLIQHLPWEEYLRSSGKSRIVS